MEHPPPLPETPSDTAAIDAHSQRFRHSFDLLLSIHHTCGKTRLEGDALGEGDSTTLALAIANSLQHPRVGSAGISAREQLRRRGSF